MTAAATCEIAGNTLRVSGQLVPSGEKELFTALHDILAVDEASLVMDFSELTRMSGSYLPCFALMVLDANLRGRTITVRATRSLSRLLLLAGLNRLGTIEEVGRSPSHGSMVIS